MRKMVYITGYTVSYYYKSDEICPLNTSDANVQCCMLVLGVISI